jgi:copper chaperone CopZ
MMKKKYTIPDMHCPNCVMHLEALEDELPGIKRVNASYVHQRLEVEYDEGQVSEMQIIDCVKKKGYTIKD